MGDVEVGEHNPATHVTAPSDSSQPIHRRTSILDGHVALGPFPRGCHSHRRRQFFMEQLAALSHALPTDTLASVWIQIDISTTGHLTFRARK